jgi:hypothetical protein
MHADRTSRGHLRVVIHPHFILLEPLCFLASLHSIFQCEAFTAIDSFTAAQLRNTETVVSTTRQAPRHNDDSACHSKPGTHSQSQRRARIRAAPRPHLPAFIVSSRDLSNLESKLRVNVAYLNLKLSSSIFYTKARI